MTADEQLPSAERPVVMLGSVGAVDAALRARLTAAADTVAADVRPPMRFPLDQLVADLHDQRTTGVLVTWSDEDEIWFVLGGGASFGPDDHDPAHGAFWVDAPADLVAVHEQAKAQFTSSLAGIVAAGGLDPEGVGLAEVCEAWQGVVHEDRPMVAVHHRPDDALFWAPNAAAAAARIDAMPERLHLLGPRGEVEEVNRAALTVRPKPATSWRSMCSSCGHPFDAHEAPSATSMEAL